MFLAQTIVEYGLVEAVVSGFQAAVDEIEYYIGSGNLKYYVLAAVLLLIVLLFRRRRSVRLY